MFKEIFNCPAGRKSKHRTHTNSIQNENKNPQGISKCLTLEIHLRHIKQGPARGEG